MPPIIFFDGFCILCNGFVDFIFRLDKRHTFRFAPLQGKTALNMLDKDDINGLESIVYLDESGIFKRSAAVLRILTRMGWPFKGFGIFFLVPSPIRDGIYDFIGKNRYKWFGSRDACRIPTPKDRGRLLD